MSTLADELCSDYEHAQKRLYQEHKGYYDMLVARLRAIAKDGRTQHCRLDENGARLAFIVQALVRDGARVHEHEDAWGVFSVCFDRACYKPVLGGRPAPTAGVRPLAVAEDPAEAKEATVKEIEDALRCFLANNPNAGRGFYPVQLGPFMGPGLYAPTAGRVFEALGKKHVPDGFVWVLKGDRIELQSVFTDLD
jgi:hypothetical protein